MSFILKIKSLNITKGDKKVSLKSSYAMHVLQFDDFFWQKIFQILISNFTPFTQRIEGCCETLTNPRWINTRWLTSNSEDYT